VQICSGEEEAEEAEEGEGIPQFYYLDFGIVCPWYL